MKNPSLCPGFRFHPTDVELVMYYLKKKLLGKKLEPEVIAEVKLYDFSPWDLPDKSKIRNGDLEWFFFCAKSKKYSSGSRVNRATETGYWKTTGKDREVKYQNKTVAMIKTLIFHLGHPPNGKRTDWVMHEYRMIDKDLANAGVFQEEYVVCRLFEKSGAGPKNGANYGAPFDEDEWDDNETVLTEATMEITNPKNSSSALTSLTLTEPGPSIATSSENTTHVEKSNVTSLARFSIFGATNMTSTEAGPSTITFSENKRLHVPDNDDVMVLHNNNTQESCPCVKNILLLDSEGCRVAVKYYSDDWPTNSAKEAFEKSVFTKTQKTNARTEAEIAMFENNIVIYKFAQDLHFFVTGGDEENELIISTVLQGFFDAVGLLLRGNVDKKEALENLDLILLCLDEIVDGGIILETDANVIAGKVASHSVDSGAPLSEQTISQALATAREHLTRSLLNV